MLAYLETALGRPRMARLQRARVGIAGLGGLGSNIAAHLVRSGVQELVLADFDRVENSNLNRQFYFLDQVGRLKAEALADNLRRINPTVRLTLHTGEITAENAASVFNSCEIWVEAFDGAQTKKMFVEEGLKHHKRVVTVSGLAGWGNPDAIQTRNWGSGLTVVGDLISEVGPEVPPLSPRVGVGAAKEADVVLSWILDEEPGMEEKTVEITGAKELGGEEVRRQELQGPKNLLRTESPTREAKGENPVAWRIPEVPSGKHRFGLPSGIYALTSELHSLGRSNLEVAEKILRSGVKTLQYREKYKSFKEMYRECLVLRRLTREYEALLIIDDYLELALAVKADGVHIGQDDLPFQVVRELAGPDLIIGVSTHLPEQARAAQEAGADYIGVGPLYATQTKENVCAPVGLTYLHYVATHLEIPFVAIGGIKEHNLGEVLSQGAATVALVTEIVGSPDIEGKIKKLQEIIGQHSGKFSR